MATRLYLVPINGQQMVLDVPDGDLVLSDGVFVSPETAPTVTVTKPNVSGCFIPFIDGSTMQTLDVMSTQELKVCWRETITTTSNPSPIVVVDPSGGQCLCGITCWGPNLRYVQVVPVDNP